MVDGGDSGAGGHQGHREMTHPAITSCADIDPDQAEATRRSLLTSLADTGTLVLGTHFPPPTAGRVITYGDVHRLSPVPAVRQAVSH
ncbi:hypothetical protein [Planotetraspora sp. GP83]|uniref:hypothetical protein n=1 Tax=Planotetraspora sp. GP83 TaxID=3156264 RepID=UPI0035125B2C